MRTVTLIGNDINKYVASIPPIIQTKGEAGQLVVNNITSIEGDNRKGFWDVENEASPFFGASDLSNYNVQINRDGVNTFEGGIQTIRANNETKRADVELRTVLQETLDRTIIYVSETQTETPASLVQRICELYKIPFDSATIGASNSIYTTNAVYVSAAFLEPNTTVLNALQMLADVGIASIYVINGRLHFAAYETKTTDPLISISDTHDNPPGKLLSHPIIEPLEKESTGGYNIGWTGGTAIFGTSDQGKSISGGFDNPIRINSLQAAVWIGERWLLYMNALQNKITFKTQSKIGKSLQIGYPVRIIYKNMNKILDITSIDNSSDLFSTLAGVTR